MSQNGQTQNRKPVFVLIVLIIVALLLFGFFTRCGLPSSNRNEPLSDAKSTPGGDRTEIQAPSGVPGEVRNVLDQIVKRGGEPMAGYRGGTTFHNDGRGGTQALPRTDEGGNSIGYREYDVHPYQKGINRGAERIIRGSNGWAYYTSDHYRNFTRIQ